LYNCSKENVLHNYWQKGESQMLVGERMSHPVITIHPEMPMPDALHLMKKEHIRRLPVVDKKGNLVGMVSENDLLHASPSDVTSLSVWEVTYLVSKIQIKRIMAKDVITVTEDTPLEEAARIMADNKIGGVPVVREGKVTGIITETDLFKVFLELLGARAPGVRLAALIQYAPGQLAQVTKSIFDHGGNIIALGTFLGESSENREITMKVSGLDSDTLRTSLEPYVEKIIDICETS
jgi:acetoin utilization protein AcuB